MWDAAGTCSPECHLACPGSQSQDLVHISHSQSQPYKKIENIVECSAESPERINAHVHMYTRMIGPLFINNTYAAHDIRFQLLHNYGEFVQIAPLIPSPTFSK